MERQAKEYWPQKNVLRSANSFPPGKEAKAPNDDDVSCIHEKE